MACPGGLMIGHEVKTTSHTASSGTPQVAGLRLDLIAGLTASAIILPKAMAYATVAGLPVSVGLYTAFVPMIVYAFLGTSRVLSVSSSATLGILVATQLTLVVPDGDPGRLITATATLTALSGLLLIAAAVLRLGFVANFISAPVLTGFKAGVGAVIILDQTPKLFGFHIEKEGFFRDILSIVRHLPETSVITLIISVTALLVLLVVERIRPHSPVPLLVVGGGIAASWYFSLGTAGVPTVGHIPQGLPPITLPSLDIVLALLPGAVGIALMSFTESIAAARAFEAPSDPPINANRELLATGAANLAGAFLGSMAAGGGTSQTNVVRKAGGLTQRVSLVVGAASVATMLFLAPLVGLLPYAILAAIVIFYSRTLIQPAEFAAIRKVRRMEFRWALAAFLGVLIFGTLQGIVIAIILSLLGLGHQASHPKVHVIGRKRGEDFLRPVSGDHPDDETIDGLLILQPEGRLFFANAQQVSDTIKALVAEHKPRVVVLDLSRVFDIEYSALQMMKNGEQRMTEEGQTVWLAGLTPDVLAYVRSSGFAAHLGDERLLSNTRAAIRKYLEMPTQTDQPVLDQAPSGPSGSEGSAR